MGRNRPSQHARLQSPVNIAALARQDPVCDNRLNADSYDFETLLQFDMEIATFTSNWVHCDQLSTFLAKMISHNRTDSVRYSSLFSLVFNELLEVAFRGCHTDGELECRILRSGNWDRIELTYPCTEYERAFIEEISARTARNVLERYLPGLSGNMIPVREVMLAELVANYRAWVRTGDVPKDKVRLIVDVPLEELVI